MSRAKVTLTPTFDPEGFQRITEQVAIDVTKFSAAMERASWTLRAWSARIRGQRELAKVIRDQPGRHIVREGMVDVLEWLGEKP